MTLTEKVNVTTGTGWSQGLCVGNTAPAVHVGFPSLCLQDGPLGLRFVDHATAWPAALTVGATFNRELAFRRGAGHGEEARKKGVHVLLGPSMGPLGRMPGGGRFATTEIFLDSILTVAIEIGRVLARIHTCKVCRLRRPSRESSPPVLLLQQSTSFSTNRNISDRLHVLLHSHRSTFNP